MTSTNGFLFEAIRHVEPSPALAAVALAHVKSVATDNKDRDTVTWALGMMDRDAQYPAPPVPARPKLWSEVERSLPDDPVIKEAVRRKGARERVMSRMCDQMQGDATSSEAIWALAKRLEMAWGVEQPVDLLVMSAALALVYRETMRQLDQETRLEALAVLFAKASVVRELVADGSGGWMGLAGEESGASPHDYLNMTGRDLPNVRVFVEGDVKWRCGREDAQGGRLVYIPDLSASIQIDSILRPWVENRLRRRWLELYEMPAQVEHNPELAEELESLNFVIGCGVLHHVRWYAPDVCAHVHKALNPPAPMTPEEEAAAIDG